MFYINSSDQYIQDHAPFTLGETQYAQNWLNLSSPAEKAALGIVEVSNSNTPSDPRYYWVSEKLSHGVRTYTNTPKDISMIKIYLTEHINATAFAMLSPSDWMVVKSIESVTPVPTAWSTWRALIRQTASTATLAIAAAATMADVEAVMTNLVWANDPSVVII